MTATVNINRLIVLTPNVCGGRPRIDGSRITVQYIINEIKAGSTPEEILEDKPHITLAVSKVFYSFLLKISYGLSQFCQISNW